MTSHDGEGHIIRMFEFNHALSDGHFPVRWSKRLNWGLGYPYFNYNYPLTYYFTSTLVSVGMDLLTSFKFVLLISFPLGGFFAYLWLQRHFGIVAAIMGGFFYTLIPYHFLNVYVRGNIAEVLALTLVPLVFWMAQRLSKEQNSKNASWLSIGLTILMLTHNITALLFLPLILTYLIILGLPKMKISYLKFIMVSYGLMLLLSAFFWIPAFYYKSIIIIDREFGLYFKDNFPSLMQLIYSPWGFGGSNTGAGQMSPQIGLLHQIVVVLMALTMFMWWRKFITKEAILFVIIFVGTFFMMLSVSTPIWEQVKMIQYLQFPWRLLAIIALSSSFLIAYFFAIISQKLSSKVMLLLVVISVVALFYLNRNHWRVNEYYSLPPYWFDDRPMNTTTTVDGEHTPIWQKENDPNSVVRFEVLVGQAEVESLVWQTNLHQFRVKALDMIYFLDRTVYFPGWKVFVDGQLTPIKPVDEINKGLIGVELAQGEHLVEVKLQETMVEKAANNLSIGGLILILSLLIKDWPGWRLRSQTHR